MAAGKAGTLAQKEIRIGLLGCGFMGKCHTNAYRKIPYIYPEANLSPRLSLLCDKDEQKVGREAARYGFDRYCGDWHELVTDPAIDVFDNCGPDPVHVEPTIAALQNGKHVICEKPMAIAPAATSRLATSLAVMGTRG